MITLHIDMVHKSSIPLSQQIYRAIKDMILNGVLGADEKLPSSRELANSLAVSRNSVLECYEQLMAEGYIYSKGGSGTYVCAGLEYNRNMEQQIPLEPVHFLETTDTRNLEKAEICFRTGIPDLSLIPIKKWGRIYHQIALDIENSRLDYQDAYGDIFLRTELAAYLNRARGTCTTPAHILITGGAAQAFNLLCHLIRKDEYALVENPLSHGICHTLESNHIRIKPIAVDEQGMQTSQLPENPPKLIFTTPSHQFPTGAILPAGRRIEMVKYAQEHGAYIVEDDYDSEFRFAGRPIQSMQHLDPEHVIYVGTFSKTLMPALRIGYMLLPDRLCEVMREEKYTADIHSPVLEQRTLAQFIRSGAFERHIRNMHKVYLRKRNRVIDCLKKSFGDKVAILGEEAGLHLAARFSDISFDDEVLCKIEEQGLQVTAMSKHYLQDGQFDPYADTLVFGYGNVRYEDIETGIQTLAGIVGQ